jgi:spore protease
MEHWESDLASECGATQGDGVRVQSAQVGGCSILRVRVDTEEAAARIGKPCGRYVTLEFGNVCKLEQREEERVCRAIAVEMREMARRMCPQSIKEDPCVLLVGLGNAEMTADALGVQAARALCVTRHLPQEDRVLLTRGSGCRICAFSPGVSGQTGIESAELVRGAVWSIRPDLVVAVDALAARSPTHLAATVQLCDSGIQPGSGVGRGKGALTQKTLGVPVMAVGMPTVIRCGALVADALGKEMHGGRFSWDVGKDLCVCPGEIDLVVARAARMLAYAVEKAFCT